MVSSGAGEEKTSCCSESVLWIAYCAQNSTQKWWNVNFFPEQCPGPAPQTPSWVRVHLSWKEPPSDSSKLRACVVHGFLTEWTWQHWCIYYCNLWGTCTCTAYIIGAKPTWRKVGTFTLKKWDFKKRGVFTTAIVVGSYIYTCII